MINKISIGLAQSEKGYGLNQNNKIQEVLKELNNHDIVNLDTSLSYNSSYNYLKDKNLNNYNLSIKLPKISNRKNLKNKIIQSLEEIFIKYNIKKFDTLLLHDPLLPLESEWKSVKKILFDYKKKKKIKNIGVSVYNKHELENILKVFKPDVVQFPLNIFFQSFDERYLRKLKKLKIKLHARSIFLQGLLIMQKSKIPIFFDIWKNHLARYHKIIRDNKFDIINFNLNFILNQKILDKVVIGFSDRKQFLQIINIIKRFKENKIYQKFYKELAINDKLINDPRFWPRNKDKISFKTYKKWINNKKIINGGVGLLSKRPDLYLPVGWPTYYSKAKGCFIWDEYGKKYLDFSLMGVGTNILGYADKDVNKVSINKIKSSNSSTLISSDEVNLAKELISAHPWSGKTVFARTGGEANAVALRIARLSNKKKRGCSMRLSWMA
jgi:aryl-alcohol dehydrogenase-like predicted oxidoreductase